MLANQRKKRGVRGGCLLYSDRRTLKTGRVGWGEGGYWRRWQFGPDHPRKQLQWYPPIKFLQWAFTQGFFAHSFTSERRAACRRRPSASVDWNHNVHTRGENKHCKSHKSGKTHKKYCGNLLAGTVAKQAGGSRCICSYWSRGVTPGRQYPRSTIRYRYDIWIMIISQWTIVSIFNVVQEILQIWDWKKNTYEKENAIFRVWKCGNTPKLNPVCWLKSGEDETLW